MTNFKHDEHQNLYLEMLRVLESNDTYYESFAYLASGIGKPELLSALGSRRINPVKLISLSAEYSNSERAVLEAAWQLFAGNNLYEIDDKPRFSTIDDIFQSLDSENRTMLFHAIKGKYFSL